MEKIAFIGAGNLANSLLQGLSKCACPAQQLYVFDIDAECSAGLAKTYPGIHVCADASTAVQQAGIVLLCVKPNEVRAVSEEIRTVLHKQLLISVAAGVRLSMLRKWASITTVIRCMPNLPVAVGHGMSVLCAGEEVSAAQRTAAEAIFKAVGKVAWVTDEGLMEQVTALSGSGPAYLFYLLQALQDAAVELGMERDLAKQLTLQTALGATTFAQESALSLNELCDKVTSKGGTTEPAMVVLEQENLRVIFKRTLQAAADRCAQISVEMDQ